jgi:hypothetical protein
VWRRERLGLPSCSTTLIGNHHRRSRRWYWRMSDDMTGGTLEINMSKRFAISFELDDNRRYDSLVLRLRHLGAVPVLRSGFF